MRTSHRSSRTYNSSPSDLRPDKRWFCVQKQLQEQTQPAACSLILTAQCCRGKQGGPGSQMLLDQAGETLETQVAYWSAYVKLGVGEGAHSHVLQLSKKQQLPSTSVQTDN